MLGDLGEPVVLGTQDNRISGLNGWIGEVIALPKQYSPSTRAFDDLSDNLLSYYFRSESLRAFGLTGDDPSSVAYGLRKLAKGYKGPAIEVFNGQQSREIGFTSAGLLDTLALKQFCPGNCTVSKWYDQSGHARHAVQQNESLQPSIVINGKVVRKNSIPSLYFAGSSSKKVSLSSRAFQDFDQAFSLFVVGGAQNDPAGDVTLVSRTNQQYPSPWDMYDDTFLTDNDAVGSQKEDHTMKLIKPINSSGFGLWSFMSNYDSVGAYFNDSSNINIESYSSPASWNVTTVEPLIIGSRDDNFTYLNGYISEVVTFPKLHKQGKKVWNRVALDQMAHFGIGETGNCLNFDAAKRNYVELGAADPMMPPSNVGFTIESWVKMKEYTQNTQPIISFIGNLWVLPDSANRPPALIVRTYMSDDLIDSTFSFHMNEWAHVAWTFDGNSTLKLYVNGKQVDSAQSVNMERFLPSQPFVRVPGVRWWPRLFQWRDG